MLDSTARLQQGYSGPGGAVGELLQESGFSYSVGSITWWRIGVGYYPVTTEVSPYDKKYFERFARQAATLIGFKLLDCRTRLVSRHYDGRLCDVGIGSGAFIIWRGRTTYGWDVNPVGLEWLKARHRDLDPNTVPFPAVSMWDVLEHIQDFIPLLRNVRRWLFLSLPIFRDVNHVLGSKHFRPDEHCWYFTRDGLVWIMEKLGFELMEENNEETQIGREDIMSFAFRRLT